MAVSRIWGTANQTKLTYPNGWVEEYSYDAEGNLLKTVDTDPFHNNKKSTKYEYTYDAEGNLITEYQRDSDGEAGLVTNTTHTYDALNRLTGSKKVVERTRQTYAKTYTYDSLGNLVQENGPDSRDQTTYQYNSLNQMVARKECGYIQSVTRIHDYGYTYDGRGNLVKEEEICSPTTQGPKNITIATYTYDETNKMVSGTNKDGEVSNYTFNGLGVRVGTEVIVKDNTHGYTDFHCQTPTVETGIDKPEVVLSDYVIDYTRLNIDQRVLVESETDGYDFRYTYGLDLVNVKASGEGTNWWAQSVKKCVYSDYVHTDRLGSVVNLTDQYGRVPAQIDYDDWGKVTAYQSLNISGGYRTVLPEITYAGHQYDDVLGMYYAKARMYDAENRRFASVDPVKGRITEPMTMVQYLYVVDNPLRWVDLLGLRLEEPLRPEGVVHDVPALPWGTELVAKQGNLKLYDSYSTSGKVLATIPYGGSVFSQNAAKTNANITWYKVSYNGKTGWVDASYFKEKTSAPAASPAPTPALTPEPEITPPLGSEVIDHPQQGISIWDKLITVGLGAGYGVAILVSFAAENAATISGWRSQLGHAIQDFELDPFGAVSAIENAAKGIPVIEDVAAYAIEGYQDFVHWGTDFGVESYDSINDFLNNAHDTVSGAKDSLGDAYQERVGCPGSSPDSSHLSPELMLELEASGEKYTKENVLRIMKSQEGQLVWLETGSSDVGFTHILERHKDDFARRGIPASEIPDLLESAITHGTNLGQTPNGATKFEVEYKGTIQKVQITISSNGFIIQANPGRW